MCRAGEVLGLVRPGALWLRGVLACLGLGMVPACGVVAMMGWDARAALPGAVLLLGWRGVAWRDVLSGRGRRAWREWLNGLG